MTILIVYGTNSSGTESVSQLISSQLTAAGHQVTVVRANASPPADMAKYDAVLLGSCTWIGWAADGSVAEGQLQEHMAAFAAKCQGQQYTGKPFAVFGLGDSSYTNFCAAADHLEKLVRDLGGRLLVPSLRIDGYYFDRDNNDQLVVDWAKQIIQSIS